MAAETRKLIQMRMFPATVERVESLKKTLGLGNRTDAIKAAIDISIFVVEALRGGKSVVVEEVDPETKQVRSRESIFVPGIRAA